MIRPLSVVRKHRAPKRALRLNAGRGRLVSGSRIQKAPSAKRCIKTDELGELIVAHVESESTERQKVH